MLRDVKYAPGWALFANGAFAPLERNVQHSECRVEHTAVDGHMVAAEV